MISFTPVEVQTQPYTPVTKEKKEPGSPWTQFNAVNLARLVEDVAPQYGAHVALTGGCLYKDGLRKDVDLLFYTIRQVDKIDRLGLLMALEQLGFVIGEQFGWVTKATFYGKDVDLFFPELYPSAKPKTFGSFFKRRPSYY